MSRIITFVFLTVVTPLMPSFFFFIGVKLGYVDYYGIEEYFNVIFVDKISWLFFWAFGLATATLFISPFKRVAGLLLIVATVVGMTTLLPGIGKSVGNKMFAKEPFYIKQKPWTYKGVLLYEGRSNYYLLNEENNRTMIFNKGKIDEAY